LVVWVPLIWGRLPYRRFVKNMTSKGKAGVGSSLVE
jgi:hypothetical protein